MLNVSMSPLKIGAFSTAQGSFLPAKETRKEGAYIETENASADRPTVLVSVWGVSHNQKPNIKHLACTITTLKGRTSNREWERSCKRLASREGKRKKNSVFPENELKSMSRNTRFFQSHKKNPKGILANQSSTHRGLTRTHRIKQIDGN